MDDEQTRADAAWLRAALPGCAVLYDPWLRLWLAVRGRRYIAFGSTPAKLLARANAAMSAATELAAALADRHVAAVPQGDAVRAWTTGTGSSFVLITPSTEGDQPVWSWQHRGKVGSHARDDIPGAAAAIIRMISASPP